jgi:hypothetical protein
MKIITLCDVKHIFILQIKTKTSVSKVLTCMIDRSIRLTTVLVMKYISTFKTDIILYISILNKIILEQNPATFSCLSHARTWISNVICRVLFYVQWGQKWLLVVFDIGGNVDHHHLNFLFINYNTNKVFSLNCLTVAFIG